MKTARNVAIVDSVTLGISEERVLRFLGEYVGVGDFYLKYSDMVIPSWLENDVSHENFIEYALLIIRDEEKNATKGREQRLKDTGWNIHASNNDNIFVVSNISGDWQVLHFYKNNSIPMVEGYFANLLSPKARRELFNDPDEFVKNFHLYCSDVVANWSTLELNIYGEPVKKEEK